MNASNVNGLDRKYRMAKAQYNPTLMHMKYDMTAAKRDQPENSCKDMTYFFSIIICLYSILLCVLIYQTKGLIDVFNR